ncbi:MAG: hypothetical protein H6833_07420 [Planctomycetes bacterium]|nr:hypothetical protein [Planctomycetota bacterium]
MRTMFFQELREGSPFIVLFMALYTAVLFAIPGVDVWLVPDPSMSRLILLFAPIIGAVIGLLTMIWDDVFRVREYVLHRGVSASAIYWNRVAQGVFVIAVWSTLPLFVRLVGYAGLGLDGQPFRGDRYVQYVLLHASMLAGFGAGVFAGNLRMQIAQRVFLFIYLVAAVLMLDDWFFSNVDLPGAGERWGFSLMHGCLATLFLWAGRGAFRLMQDRQRLVPPSAQGVSALLLLTLFPVLWNGPLRFVQRDYAERIRSEYPLVVLERHEGPVLALELDVERRRIRTACETNHRPLSPTLSALDVDRVLFDPGRHVSREFRYLDTRWIRLRRPDVYLDAETGWIHRFREGCEQAPTAHQVFGPGDQPCPRPFLIAFTARYMLIGKPGQAATWAFDTSEEECRLLKLSLPNEGRLDGFGLDVVFVKLGERTEGYRLTGIEVPDSSENARAEWERADPGANSTPQVSRTSRADPLDFEVAIESEGKDTFSHHYYPRTVEEQALARCLFGLTTVRSPGILLSSFFDRDPGHAYLGFSYEGALFREPLVHAGKRPWLLGLAFVLPSLLALWSLRILRRRNVTTSARWFVSLVILLGGFPAFLAVMIAVKGRPAALEAQAAPPLLIGAHA